MAIKLGSKVRDNITGFEGIAVARTEHLHGCARITIEPTKLKDGKPIDAQWFDEQRVMLLKEMKPKVEPQNSARSGGPQRDANTSRAAPRR